MTDKPTIHDLYSKFGIEAHRRGFVEGMIAGMVLGVFLMAAVVKVVAWFGVGK